jgi:hypothetical protein
MKTAFVYPVNRLRDMHPEVVAEHAANGMR